MNKRFATVTGLLLLTIFAAQTLQAATLYWDGSASSVNGQSDNTSTTAMNWLGGGNWDDGATSAAVAAWTDGDSVVFGGSAASETITAGNLTVGNMTFGGGGLGANPTATSYTIATSAGSTITLQNSTITTNESTANGTTISALLAGSTGLIKAGISALDITNANNTFSGIVQINQGRLHVSSAGALGTTTQVNVVPGGQFANWDGSTAAFAQNFNIAGTGWGETNYEAAMRLGSATYNGVVTLTGNATIASNGTAILSSGIAESGGSYNATFGTSGMTSTVELRGANTYTGLTTVNYGTVVIGSSAAANTTASIYGGTIASALSVNNSGYLRFYTQVPHNITATGSITSTGSNYIYLGNSYNAATLNLNGGTISPTSYSYFHLGNATFNLNSGTVGATGTVYAYIGDGGLSNWNQSGGTAKLSTAYLGYSSGGANSALTLSGGTMNVAGTMYVGYSSSAANTTLTVSGGTLNSTSSIYTGYSSASTVAVSSGSLTSTGTIYEATAASPPGPKPAVRLPPPPFTWIIPPAAPARR
jgi:autotransporter-associated beta strand protein